MIAASVGRAGLQWLELSALVVALSSDGCRRRSGSLTAPCGLEGTFRGRCLAGSPSDTADRQRIHADLAAVGLALRP